MTMKRRSLLRAAGLAAIVDLKQVAADGTTATRDTSGPPPRSILHRAGAAPVDGHLLASFARGPAVEAFDDLPKSAQPSAAGAILTDAALVRVYRGIDTNRALPDPRDTRYRRTTDVGGREAVVRRDRGRVRLFVDADGSVLVGTGPEPPAVGSLLVSLTDQDGPAVDDTVVTVLEHLGDGVAAVIERPGPDATAPAARRGVDDPVPVLTGERVALEDGEASLRRVAVYPSREASLVARERGWGPWPAEGPVERDGVTRTGRTVVRDATAEDPAAVLEASD